MKRVKDAMFQGSDDPGNGGSGGGVAWDAKHVAALRGLTRKLGLRQQDMAVAWGHAPCTLSFWLNGKHLNQNSVR